MRNGHGWGWAALLGLALLAALGARAEGRERPERREKMIGMYVHQHWPYRHPYAARTWTLEDWRGYAGGLKQLGYNTILVWPLMEVMPDPPTPSDTASLEKMSKVIDMLHHELGMRAYVVLCPNIIARDAEASKATFETRHYFYSEDLVNPGDPAAVARMIARREKLLRYLKNADGVTMIDSDPGGYPGSTIEEYVHLLGEHRKMFDRLRPGIELVYWMHAGWRGWSKMYEIGKISFNTPAEYDETVTRLMKLDPKPWGMANGLEYARKHGIEDKVISFNYGRIEGEPSYPMTNFGGTNAYEGARSEAPRGVMGNAQTHCVQLPNTFAFARGAQGLPLAHEDYVRFADDLIPGHGARIVRAWTVLSSGTPVEQRASAAALEAVAATAPEGGPLKGLLFGSPQRFLTDLVLMLRQKASVEDLAVAVDVGQDPTEPLRRVIADASAWQSRHGYENNWGDGRLLPALRKLNLPPINEALSITDEVQGPLKPGQTAFEEVRQNFARVESLTPRLLDAMRASVRLLEERRGRN
jgi:hypothetical protein